MGDEEVSFGELLARLWNGRVAIVLATLVCTAVAVAWVYSREPTTTAELLLEIGTRPPKIELGTESDTDLPILLEAPASLVARIDTIYGPLARRQAADAGESAPTLRTAAVTGTDLVRLSASCPDDRATACRKLLEAVAHLVQEKHSAEFERARSGVAESLAAERRLLQTLRDALDLQKTALAQMPLAPDPTRKPPSEENFSSLVSQMAATQLLLETTNRLPRAIVISEHAVLVLERLVQSLRDTKVLSVREETRAVSLVPIGAGIVGGLTLGCLIALVQAGRRMRRRGQDDGSGSKA